MSLSNKKFTQTEIGLIPDDWQVTITKKCLSIPITDGPHETPILYEDGIPFISAESVSSGNGRIDFSRMRGYISEEYHQECCKKYKPQKNDVYIIKSGSTTGKVAIVKTDQVFNIWSPLAVLRAKQDIVPDYLFYAVQSSYYQEQIIQAWGMGTQQNIGMRTLEHLKVAYPEYDEQHAIATTLSDMDALIEAKTALLEKKRAIKQGALQELLTGRRRLPGFAVTPMKQTDIGEIPEDWNVCRMGKLGTFLTTASYTRSELSQYGDVACIHYGDIHTKYRTWLNLSSEEVPHIDYGKVKNYPFLQDGDLIIADASEDYAGLSDWVELTECHDKKCIGGLHTIVFRPEESIFSLGYLGLISSIGAVKRQLVSRTVGTKVYSLTSSMLRDLLFPIPSNREEQSAIYKAIWCMDSEIKTIEAEIAKLRDLKQGMMRELLTGRIRLVK